MKYKIKTYDEDKNKFKTYKNCVYDSDDKSIIIDDESSFGPDILWHLWIDLLNNENLLLFRGNKTYGVLTYDMIENVIFDVNSAYCNYNIHIIDSPYGNIIFTTENWGEMMHIFFTKHQYEHIKDINIYLTYCPHLKEESITYNKQRNSITTSDYKVCEEILKHYGINNKTLRIYSTNNSIISCHDNTITFDYSIYEYDIKNIANSHIIINDNEQYNIDNQNHISKEELNEQKPIYKVLSNNYEFGLYDISTGHIEIDKNLELRDFISCMNNIIKSNSTIVKGNKIYDLDYKSIKALIIPEIYKTQGVKDIYGDGSCIVIKNVQNASTKESPAFISYDRLQTYKYIDANSGMHDNNIFTDDTLCVNNGIFRYIIKYNAHNFKLPNLKVFMFTWRWPDNLENAINDCLAVYYYIPDSIFDKNDRINDIKCYTSNYLVLDNPAQLLFVNDYGNIKITI